MALMALMPHYELLFMAGMVGLVPLLRGLLASVAARCRHPSGLGGDWERTDVGANNMQQLFHSFLLRLARSPGCQGHRGTGLLTPLLPIKTD